MVDLALGYDMGKMQIETIRNQMEYEHSMLADMVAMELNGQGYPCEVKDAGTQRFRGIKVKKWIIISKDPNIDPEKFTKIKDKLTRQLAKDRQSVMKQEMKELKRKNPKKS